MLTLDPSQWDVIVCPVSGGKDSQCLLSLALQTPGVREKLRVVHQFTGYDHPLTHDHLRWMMTFYGVCITSTRHHRFIDIFDFIRKEKYFPSSLARSCTSRLKIKPFGDWLLRHNLHKQRTLVLLGMRAAESANRAAAYSDIRPTDLFTLCDISKDYPKKCRPIQVQLPIVQWTLTQVLDHVYSTGAKLNPLYAKGHKRVGCYPCLLAGLDEWHLAARDPVGQAHIQQLLDIEAHFKANASSYASTQTGTCRRSWTTARPTRVTRWGSHKSRMKRGRGAPCASTRWPVC